MSTLDLLRQGIENQDWHSVAQAYEGFTGVAIAIPEPSVNIEVDGDTSSLLTVVQAAIAAEMKKWLSGKIFTSNFEPDLSNKIEPTQPVKPKKKSQFVDETNEPFVDDGTIAANEIIFSKKFSEVKKPEPRRPPEPKVSAKCSKCGKDKVVPAVLGPRKIDGKETSTYVCDGCVHKSGV